MTNPTPDTSSALERAKRRVYLACAAVGLPILLLEWSPWKLPSSTRSPLEHWLAYPALLAFGLWFMYGLLSRRIPLEALEKQVLPIIGLFFAVQVVSANLAGRNVNDISGVVWTLMILSTVSYFIRPMREVGGWVALLYALYVATPWLRLGLGFPLEGELEYLFTIQVVSGMTLALIYVQAWYREQLLRERLERQILEQLAYTDPLTGAANRRRMYALLEREAAKATPGASVVLFDLDHFKRLNDRFGHSAGDEVLRRVADAVRGEVRGEDVLGRWGGEEFLLLIPDTPLEQAARVAERLRSSLARLELEFETSGGEVLHGVTASFGVAALDKGERPEKWVERADDAMYAAKQSGRNAVRASSSAGGAEGVRA